MMLGGEIRYFLLCLWCCVINVSYEQNESTKKEINFGLLDIRIGKILRVENLPNTTDYYQLKVYFGSSATRTIVCGLAEIMKKEEFGERLTPFLLNIEPVSLHNVTSHGSVLYTQGPDSEEGFTMTELLNPPLGAEPDDRVVIEGISYNPVENLDYSTAEKIFSDLTIDMNRIAKYRRKQYLNVTGKGILLSTWVKDAPLICESCPNNPGLKSEFIVKKKNIKELNEGFKLDK